MFLCQTFQKKFLETLKHKINIIEVMKFNKDLLKLLMKVQILRIEKEESLRENSSQ